MKIHQNINTVDLWVMRLWVEFVSVFICVRMTAEILTALYYMLCFLASANRTIPGALKIVTHEGIQEQRYQKKCAKYKIETVRQDDQRELFFLSFYPQVGMAIEPPPEQCGSPGEEASRRAWNLTAEIGRGRDAQVAVRLPWQEKPPE